MEKEVLADKEISDYLDKYDISYWNTLITKLAKIGIRTLIKEDPNIYTIDEIDNVLKKNAPNEEKEEENNIYETHDTKSLSINDLNSEREIPIKKKYEIGKTSYPKPVNYDYSYKPKYNNSYFRYTFQKPMLTYSTNFKSKKTFFPTYDLNTRARSPKYTYENNNNKIYDNIFSERKPLNYIDNGNNYSVKLKSYRSPSFNLNSNGLPCLNYDYNNYTFKDYNLDDDCFNKSKDLSKSYSTYRPSYTSGC